MGAHRLGQIGRIERGRDDVIAPFDRLPASDLAGGLNHRDGSELGEAVFTRVAAVRSHPGDVMRDDPTARLDRPWSLSMSTWTLRLSAGATSKKAAISPRRLGWFSFTASTKSAPLPVIASAMVGLQAMASMVTSAPSSAPAAASRSRSFGIAFCSQDLSATAAWPSTRRSLVTKAETRWSAYLPAPRSWLRREVLPSMATSLGASGQVSCTHLMKQVENTSGSTRFISVRSQSAQGTP